MIRLHLFGAAVVAGLLAAAPVLAAPTQYPLTIRNCGNTLTFAHAPERAVSLGQAGTETLYRLGLADKVVGTAVWFGPVLPQFAAANDKIKRLADNDPSFESVVGQNPDFVAAQYQWHVGQRGSVGKPEQFAALGIPAYVAPADCEGKDNSGGGDGVRVAPLTMAPVYQEIREIAEIFDVADRGDALIARLQQREKDAIASIAGTPKDLPILFWFSSRDVKGDPFVAGRNGAPAYIMNALGERDVITVNDEWPTVSWEAIAAANPAVIVIARMDRRRFPADDVDVKMHFLETDPVASQLDAVRNKRIVVMDAQAMNPGLRMIDGIEALANGIRASSAAH
jgi:iron complex transport system substrate-binding protein